MNALGPESRYLTRTIKRPYSDILGSESGKMWERLKEIDQQWLANNDMLECESHVRDWVEPGDDGYEMATIPSEMDRFLEHSNRISAGMINTMLQDDPWTKLAKEQAAFPEGAGAIVR